MPSALCIAPTTMGFEFQRAFQTETRRLLWLVGVVFGTILLFQCIELPKGNGFWSMLSWGESSHDQRSSSFFSQNATFNPILSNTSSPSIGNTSTMHEKSNEGSQNSTSSQAGEGQNDPFTRDPPKSVFPSENHTSGTSSTFFETPKGELALPPLQSANYSLSVAETPISPGPIASENSSAFIESPKENLVLSPLQSANYSLSFAEPPVAPPPLAVNVSEVPNGTIVDSNFAASNQRVETSNSSDVKVSLPAPSISIPVKAEATLQKKEVLTLSDMNELLVQSQKSPYPMVPRWSTRADGELVFAKSQIENAPLSNSGLYAPLYRNASMFQRSYESMEQMLKIYIYQEGDKRIFHRPPLEGIYASEGWFMKLLEANRHFVTRRPDEAHLFYLPFSSRQLEENLYIRNSHSHKNMVQFLKDYLDMISSKYPFWNRTNGADHFLVACHDWAPSETKRYMANCIRALCNADVKEGFKFGKDVSLPETYVRKAKDPLRNVGGKPASKRQTLAFYAGNMHGYLRPILLQYWGNKSDPDMQIFGRMPYSKDNRNYVGYMKSSKYCICPRGYEVNSPRVVEAIFYECVPVIISDNFIPPFFETLNWGSFAVFVAEKDIPSLKNILLSIPQKTYSRMYMRVRKVQQHFLWHPKPVKYDLFHMILHSIWYNRVFQFRPR